VETVVEDARSYQGKPRKPSERRADETYGKNIRNVKLHFILLCDLCADNFRSDKHVAELCSRHACAETRLGLCVKCPLLSSDLIQNWDVSTNCNKTVY
jgi:hypothetical protein